MNRKIVLTGLAALALAASAAPASAQGFSVGVGFGDGWYGPGVSVGFGAPGWGYDNNWGYGAYAAAPCTCGTSYRSVRVAPRYRSSTYAWGGYPYDNGYASYPYDDYYYGGNYASVGVGWSDGDWRRRSFRLRWGQKEPNSRVDCDGLPSGCNRDAVPSSFRSVLEYSGSLSNCCCPGTGAP